MKLLSGGRTCGWLGFSRRISGQISVCQQETCITFTEKCACKKGWFWRENRTRSCRYREYRIQVEEHDLKEINSLCNIVDCIRESLHGSWKLSHTHLLVFFLVRLCVAISFLKTRDVRAGYPREMPRCRGYSQVVS